MAQPTAGTEVPHGTKGAFPQFRTDTFASQLVWLAITFGLLYYLMAKVALPRVAAIIAARRARIEGDLATAAKARQTADEAGVALEKNLAEARAKSQALAQQTQDKLNAEADARRKALEETLAQKLAAAETQIGTIKAQAMSNVDAIARDAASAIVERMTGKAPDPAAISRAVEQAVAKA